MATDKLRVDIETVDRASAGIARIDKSLVALTATYFAFNAASQAANAAIRLLGSQLTRGVALAANYEKASFQLAKAQELLGVTNRGVTRDLLKFAEGLQLATQFTDDDIVPAMVSLTNIAGVTGEELKKLTKLTLDVAVTFNRNLNDAAVLVGKSARGVTDRMNELGLAIDDNIKGAAARGAAALELLASRSDGAAIAVGETLVGSTAQLSSAWDTLLRRFGEAVINSESMRAAIKGLTDEIVRLSEGVEGGQITAAMDALTLSISTLGIALARTGQAASGAFNQGLGILLGITSGPGLGAFQMDVFGSTAGLDAVADALGRIRDRLVSLQNESANDRWLRLFQEGMQGFGTRGGGAGGLGGGGAPDEITQIRIEGYDALQRAIEQAGDREIAMWARLRQQAQQGIEPWVEFENTMAGIADQQITIEQNNQQMLVSMEDLASEAAYFGANVVAAGIEGRLELGRMIRAALAGLAAMIVRAALFRAILAGASSGGGGATGGIFTAIAGGALATGGTGTTTPITPTVSTLDPVSPLVGAPVGVNLAVALMQPSDSLVTDMMNTMSRLARTHGATLSAEVVGV